MDHSLSHIAGTTDQDLARFERVLTGKREEYWIEQGGKNALKLFHAAAERVPAYRDFLRKARIDHGKVRTVQDFSGVPVTTPENYIAAYPMTARAWDGKLDGARLIAASSGTKGEPKFWPRGTEQELEAALIHEVLYRTYFNIHKRSTLLLIGFPMGVYVSGIATVLPSWLVSLRGYRMTMMSVGNNKAEMLRAVRELSDKFQQTVLVGHPFFIKDVLETGAREGVRWGKKNLGLMFCSGGFNEAWRRYIGIKAGISGSSARIFNTYGSSEMLLMGYETPFTIKVKEFTERNSRALRDLTGEAVPPQFFQYDPLLRYIESVNRELVFTSASGIPLVRFNLHDAGRVVPFRAAQAVLPMSKRKAEFHLPLVAFWGRSDDTIKFHAVNIYPEHVRAGLSEKRFLHLLTGKFVMRKSLGKGMNEFLEINVELCSGIPARRSLAHAIQESVIKTLRTLNLEYVDMSNHAKDNVRPRILLWGYQHPHFFKPGLKPHYIARENKK